MGKIKCFAKFVPVFILLSINVFSQEKAYNNYIETFGKINVELQKENYSGAAEILEDLQERYPYQPSLIYQLARINFMRDNNIEAYSQLVRAIQLGFNIPGGVDSLITASLNEDQLSWVKELVQKQSTPVINSSEKYIIPEADLIPEGIAYDPVEEVFYVGSIWRCKIVQITKSGEISDFVSPKQDGLRSVLGMIVDPERRLLWAATRVSDVPLAGIDSSEAGWAAVFKYDLTSKKLLKKYEIHEKGTVHLLNDLDFTSSGDLFITDSEYGALYTIPADTDSLELFIDSGEFLYPNGITCDRSKNSLFMATWGNGIYKIDPETKSCQLLQHPENITTTNVDGLCYYENSLVAVQNGLNRVVRFGLDSSYSRVTGMEIIDSNNPVFITPTTGVMAGDEFFFLANAQLNALRNDGTLAPFDQLKEPLIFKINLKGERKKYLGANFPSQELTTSPYAHPENLYEELKEDDFEGKDKGAGTFPSVALKENLFFITGGLSNVNSDMGVLSYKHFQKL